MSLFWVYWFNLSKSMFCVELFCLDLMRLCCDLGFGFLEFIVLLKVFNSHFWSNLLDLRLESKFLVAWFWSSLFSLFSLCIWDFWIFSFSVCCRRAISDFSSLCSIKLYAIWSYLYYLLRPSTLDSFYMSRLISFRRSELASLLFLSCFFSVLVDFAAFELFLLFLLLPLLRLLRSEALASARL